MPVNDPGPIASALAASDWATSNLPAPVQVTDKTWFRNDSISGGNWNQLFPYQLLVVEESGEGKYTRYQPRVPSINAGGQATFQYTLPMPPESFSISMPFAINNSVTLGGHVEEHNGAPTRIITISGTTGVFSNRGAALSPKAFQWRDAIFAGTVTAARQTITAAKQTLAATGLFGNTQFIDNTIPQTDFDDPTASGSLTGWYQFRLLQIFFESYVEMKKLKSNRNVRLALATWKDEAVYLVSPLHFNVDKGAGSPLEYHYNLTFKAFKRVKLEKGLADKVKAYKPIDVSPGALSKTLNTLMSARLVLQGAKKTLMAIGGDVNRTIFEPIRQLTLLCKDTLSLPLTIADLSDSIAQDTKTAVLQITSVRKDGDDWLQNVKRAGKHVSENAQAIYDAIKSLGSEQADSAGTTIDEKVKAWEQGLRDTHPANTAFVRPSDNYDFFSNVPVGDLNLSPKLQNAIAAERRKVHALTRLDYQRMADGIQATADTYAAAIGAGHPTYNAIYGLQAPAKTIIDTPTDDDFNTLFYLNQLVLEMRRFAVTTNESAKLNAIATVAGLASRSGIAFKQPISKFAVPFPYGGTLEQLAFTYLKDPDRWLEIATLNGLQAPYVDEEGFILPLLVNGANNTVFVGSAKSLFVGQPVWIGSDTNVRSPRTITKIDILAPNQVLVTVDGPADMDQYITLANAKLEAFLPNTVNSQMVVYIPSDLEPKDEDFTTRSIPGIKEYDSFIAVGGIDLLLTPANDLVITPDGDSRWSVGLTNVIQKVRLALSVVQGTLNRHPDYGLPIEAGMSLADLSAAQVVRAAESMFAGDPTFTGIKAAKISVNGPVANLNIAVEVRGVSQIIPISAQVAP
jgi:hypothetical protein